MKYMVLECHPGYAVVLDEEGRFLKVANMHYEVGQAVTEVIPMQVKKNRRPWMASLTAAAACLALVLGLTLPGKAQPYASVYVKINPEIRIDVNQQDAVVGLEGVNEDGVTLLEGYDYHGKYLDLVTDELVDRAIDQGYLQAEGQITISLDSQDQTWVDDHSHTLSDHLQVHLQERFVVTIQIKLCTHEHPGRPHHEYEYDDGNEADYPEQTNPVTIQPAWEDDHEHDEDDHAEKHTDEHDDRDDEPEDDDRDDDRDDEPEVDDHEEDREEKPEVVDREEDRDDEPEDDDRDDDRDDEPEVDDHEEDRDDKPEEDDREEDDDEPEEKDDRKKEHKKSSSEDRDDDDEDDDEDDDD